ncbi:hypothetical protein LTR86_007586 [Recurvomyces mirabilis]|nr:hypothetical protein LTR86_007586 [Recurvomyces mirabilis]
MALINFTCPNELSPPTDTCHTLHKENAAPQQHASVQVTTVASPTNAGQGKVSATSHSAIPSTATDERESSQVRNSALQAFSHPTTSAPANIGRRRAAGLSTRLASTPPRPSRWRQIGDIFLQNPISPSSVPQNNDERSRIDDSPLDTTSERVATRRLHSESKHRILWDDNVLAETSFTPARLLGLATDTAPSHRRLQKSAQRLTHHPLPAKEAIDAWLTSTENASDTSSDEWTGDEDFLPRSARARHRRQRLQRKRASRAQVLRDALTTAACMKERKAEETKLEGQLGKNVRVDDATTVHDGVGPLLAPDEGALVAMAEGPMSVAFRERLEALRSPVVGAGRFRGPRRVGTTKQG